MQPVTLLSLFSSAALAAVHNVKVGEQGLTFDPKTITAAVGDTVIFQLFATHDVAQGPFNSPCTPSDDGFYSGAYSTTDGGKLRFVYNVTTEDPIYYYCAVQRHCQGGMVGGINLPSDGDETIDDYEDDAEDVSQASAPDGIRGGELVEDVSSLTASGGASATASPSATGSASGSGSPNSASTTPTGSAGASGTAASGGASPSSTGAAAGGQVPAIGAAMLGFAAWLL